MGDLQTVQWQIVNYWQSKEKLPPTLAELEDSISGFVVPTDKETGAVYEYHVTGALVFELCATFSRDSRGTSKDFMAVPSVYPGIEGENWQHKQGRQCFERTIDPDRYPPIPKGR